MGSWQVFPCWLFGVSNSVRIRHWSSSRQASPAEPKPFKVQHGEPMRSRKVRATLDPLTTGALAKRTSSVCSSSRPHLKSCISGDPRQLPVRQNARFSANSVRVRR